MRFTSGYHRDDGVLEREFVLGEILGTLWTPSPAPAPLILMAHNDGLPRGQARLVERAWQTVAHGYAVAVIDAAGCGFRPRTAADAQARDDLDRARRTGEPVDGLVESFIGPLVGTTVQEWRTTLDALLALPGIGGPVGYAGWSAVGIRLALVEPRITAAGFFAGGHVPDAQREEARQVTLPLLFRLDWDDEAHPRQRALDLFDAFGSKEKTLHAAVRGSAAALRFEVDEACRFYDRYLR